jgi:hypothetical protein
MFEKSIETKWNVLSLGAGVQSSALALMAASGEISPVPDFAVFADVGAEPDEVYEWLETLKDLVRKSRHPFPIYTVKKGDLTDEQLKIRVSRGKGKKPRGQTYVKKIIPMFGLTEDGEKRAAIGRSCTEDYKILPIRKMIREKCGIRRGQKECSVTMWIGISWDEIQRAKESRVEWYQHRWPMLEKRITRADCISWMASKGFPVPPRSACYYCPFHSDSEWRRMRDDDPVNFRNAVNFDRELRELIRENDKGTRMKVFLHRSCKPLGEIDFDNDEDRGQQVWDFQAECSGMCGV